MQTEERALGGRYRIDRLIGRGGMADVYCGYDERLGRTVAVKVLHRSLAADPAFRLRFKLEAQSASRMNHSSIVRVYDAGEDVELDASGAERPVPFIVMEFVSGVTLKEIIASGSVTIDEALRYTHGILEALEYSHRAGVVHRDIKPGNVMVTDDGRIKVMDFGIARAVSDTSSTVEHTTRILGTASYFSPEQAKGEQVDSRADLYSTGIVLYELLTGSPPYRGDSSVAVAYQHVRETPRPPSTRLAGSARTLDPVVLRALAKEPDRRFPDAAAFRQALAAASVSAPPTETELAALTSELYGPRQPTAEETERTLVDLATASEDVEARSGPALGWVWFGIVAAAVLVGGVLYGILTMQPADIAPSDSRTVPDLAGMTYERAEGDLAALDLVARRTDEPNATVPTGVVIRTTPEASIVTTAGDSVEVFVSSGPEQVSMPELAGLEESAARRVIADSGLQVGSIRPVDDAYTAANVVLTAIIDDARATAGDMVDPGTRVDLQVATGRVALADLTGLTLPDAVARLEAAGLESKLANVTCGDNVVQGVAKQTPKAGTVPIRSQVTVEFCTESEGLILDSHLAGAASPRPGVARPSR